MFFQNTTFAEGKDPACCGGRETRLICIVVNMFNIMKEIWVPVFLSRSVFTMRFVHNLWWSKDQVHTRIYTEEDQCACCEQHVPFL